MPDQSPATLEVEDRWLSIAEVARMLGRNPGVVTRWAQTDKLTTKKDSSWPYRTLIREDDRLLTQAKARRVGYAKGRRHRLTTDAGKRIHLHATAPTT